MAEPLKTSDFDYTLPDELVAQSPLPERGDSRMLYLPLNSDPLQDLSISNLPELLRPDDVLVLNDTRVFPARIFGQRSLTGGKVELLLIEEDAAGAWICMCRARKRPPVSTELVFCNGVLRGIVESLEDAGRIRIRFESDIPLMDILEEHGVPPLPPYIRREQDVDAYSGADRDRYQTVYARNTGAVAAPTAGLHFTPELFEALDRAGVRRAHITLHVGPGTFKPVDAEVVADHAMEEERYVVSQEAASVINGAIDSGGRVIAVGSTSVRTLETVFRDHGCITAATGRSALFIYPPYRFGVVNGILTNFHLPKSTLIMMMSAFAGTEKVRAAYLHAVEERYRFYSYGDCMFLGFRTESSDA